MSTANKLIPLLCFRRATLFEGEKLAPFLSTAAATR